MADKFRNRYRVESSRAPWWDYRNGSYFVTICTWNRIHLFGEIIDGEMYNSKIGDIAKTHWEEIPSRFSYSKLGEFIIMPNHIHGIINIRGSRDVETRFIASLNHDNHASNILKSNHGGITGIHNPMLHQNLSRVLRWYTGRVSYESHKINPEFNWQRRFDDRIIRDQEEYKIKTRYIQKNPLNWIEDEFY